ncbi:MAG: hypothetical protein ACI4SZ_06890 [Lachnospiraceae bacterium]
MDQQIKKQGNSFPRACLIGIVIAFALAGYLVMYAALLCAQLDPVIIQNWSQGAAGLCGTAGFVWYLCHIIRK